MKWRSKPQTRPARLYGGPKLERVVLIGFLILLACVGAGLLLRNVDIFDVIGAHRSALLTWRDEHLVAVAALFVLAYAAVVAVSLPVNFAMTILGGFLFGFLAGTLLSTLAVTVGATLVFSIAKANVGDRLRQRVLAEGSSLLFAKMDRRFRKNAVCYLLLLRLTPTLPSIVPNAAPAFFGVRTPTFILATLIGVVPSTVLTAWIGASLSQALAADEAPAGFPALDPYTIGSVLIESLLMER